MFTFIYHNEAEAELKALPLTLRVKLDKLIGLLQDDPRILREPHTKPLVKGLYEVRTPGNDAVRGIWVYQTGRRIYMLRIFIKKTQKTPSSELKLALRRLEEMKREI